MDRTVSSDSNETPEKPKRIPKRPLPDDDDLRSLGSYHKPIPKKLKEVDRLRQQHDLELKQLRNEIQLLRTERRTPVQTSTSRPIDQRNVMTTSQTSQPWQSSGMTVLMYPSKSDAPTITNWKINDIDAFERYCTESRLFLRMWRGEPSTTCFHTTRWIHYRVW
jgi:hypothetical protein